MGGADVHDHLPTGLITPRHSPTCASVERADPDEGRSFRCSVAKVVIGVEFEDSGFEGDSLIFHAFWLHRRD